MAHGVTGLLPLPSSGGLSTLAELRRGDVLPRLETAALHPLSDREDPCNT